jgi:hypothetical protein
MLSYYAMGREKKQVIGLNVSPDLSAQQGNGKGCHEYNHCHRVGKQINIFSIGKVLLSIMGRKMKNTSCQN